VQNQEESVEALVELGLTHLQAKVYIALVCLETATAREIHKSSKIVRPNVYRMLSELEEKDLIERVIGKPTKFRPIPPNEAISILLKKRREKTCLLEKKAIQKLRKLQKNDIETSFADMDSQFILLSKGETNPMAEFNRLREAVANAQKSVMSLTNFELFRRIKYVDEQSWKRAIQMGVKLKFITDKRLKERQINLDSALINNDNFEIRWTNTPPPTSLLLVDKKEAFFRIGIDLTSPVLLATAPQLVETLEDYFETKWKALEHN
jgi:sugar-specific transcriptional regulator TrmB